LQLRISQIKFRIRDITIFRATPRRGVQGALVRPKMGVDFAESTSEDKGGDPDSGAERGVPVAVLASAVIESATPKVGAGRHPIIRRRELKAAKVVNFHPAAGPR
jgi:hypothetical protein